MKTPMKKAVVLTNDAFLLFCLTVFSAIILLTSATWSQAVPDSTIFTCYWQPNTESDLAGYRLRWRTASAQTWQDSVIIAPHPPRVAVRVPANTEHCFAVVAFNRTGYTSEPSTVLCSPAEFYLGDINQNHRVDMFDLLLFNYLISDSSFTYDVRLDFSPVMHPNGIIDLFDKLAFLEAYNRNMSD